MLIYSLACIGQTVANRLYHVCMRFITGGDTMSNILVWAHRGASGTMPENTLPAFERAVSLGADGVELDIQLTKDGQIVVIHDERIDRTSDGKGFVKDYTLEELRQFNYNKTIPECPHADIPLMEEVFELLDPTGLTINIELKTGYIFYKDIEEQIVRMVHEHHYEDRVIYSSFNHYTIKRIQELDPDAKTGFLYADGFIDMPGYGKAHGVDALHPEFHSLQYPGFPEDCKAAGLDVNVWTVNTKEDVLWCAGHGVHAIITNYPDMARQALTDAGL